MTINAAAKSLVVKPSADGSRYSEYPAGDAPTTQARNLLYEGSFDDGKIASQTSLVDGGFIQAMKDAGYVDGNSKFPNGGAGNYGPGIDSDLRLVASEVVGSETILPRKGGYFLRGALHFNKSNPSYKDYNILSDGTVGDISGTNDKPRWGFEFSNAVYTWDYDTEWWMGFSIRIPANFDHDNPSKANKSACMILETVAESASRGFFGIDIRARTSNVASDWVLNLHTDATSVSEGGANEVHDTVTLGPCDDDVGRWTDFVIRSRANPFTVDTNPYLAGIPNSKNQLYQGNKGILEIWKSTGTTTRAMTKVFSRVNQPVGLVPHETSKFKWSVRAYKYGWKKEPTDADTPVWLGFDEIRFGGTLAHNTGYSDVHPDQEAMP